MACYAIETQATSKVNLNLGWVCSAVNDRPEVLTESTYLWGEGIFGSYVLASSDPVT